MTINENDGFKDVRELAALMKSEGIIKLQTANCLIEIHPAYLGRTDHVDQPEEKKESQELTNEERVSRAKRALGEMMGGI